MWHKRTKKLRIKGQFYATVMAVVWIGVMLGCSGSPDGSEVLKQAKYQVDEQPSRPVTETIRVPRVTRPTPAEMEAAASQGSSFVGEVAPGFTLPSEQDMSVSLADYRGQWVVLYFYPQDDTPGCTCQATEFTELLQSFGQRNAVILGVSPDEPSTHRFFKKKYNLDLTLLSDPDAAVMRQYGAWVEMSIRGNTVGRVVRSTVLIDPAGDVAWHWPEVIPEGHAQRVYDRLASFGG